MIGNFIGVSKPYQVNASMSQLMGAGSTFNYTISIDRYASASVATVVGQTLLGSPYDAYPGLITILRPASATGRASSVKVAAYPSAYDTSLIARLSSNLFGGCQLTDAYINNATAQLIFVFFNPTAGSLTATARINALVFP